MFTIQCQCGEVFHADESHVGRAIRCWKCGQILGIGSKPPTTYEEETSGSAKTKGRSEQQNQHKRLSRRKKAIVYASAGIGVLLLLLLAFSNSRSPWGGGAVLRNGSAKTDPEKVTVTINEPARSSTPPPPPLSAAPSKRLEVPIELEPVNPNRPRTGSTPFTGGIRSGKSEITVDNGTDTDAIVRVVRFREGNQQHVRNFYVRSQDRFVANLIPPGEYVLRVAFGTDWNSVSRKFNYRRSFAETQTFTIDEARWTQTREDGEVVRTRSSELSITLHKVPHGNFQSHPINEEEFWQ
jgi:hypothetical protein